MSTSAPDSALQLIIDSAPAFIHTARPDGHIDFFNRAWLEYVGLSLEDLLGWKWTVAIHPDDLDGILKKWRASLVSGEPFLHETRVRRADGQYRWMLHHKVALRDKSGKIVKWHGSSIDIEDRKRAEDSLQRALDEVKRLKDQLHHENIALREEIKSVSMFEEIVGSSHSLRRVLAQVDKVAPTDSTVLIKGETGTGKELIARAIHKRSGRSSRAFVAVNCAAIPPTVAASELFGHEKGAFTGATQRRMGRFELAAGGTIFLDEVGDIPHEIQIALLRVIQEGQYEPIGSSRPHNAVVRILAATNRDLSEAVLKGTFRQDLFYRLNVFPIEVPALRDRKEDIPPLTDYFINRFARKLNKKVLGISKKTRELLQSYGWPGNIRELQNVVERSIIVCETDTLTVDESWLTHEPPRKLAASERISIEAALAEARGRVSGPSGAAARLGMPASTLESKIRALKINKHLFKTG